MNNHQNYIRHLEQQVHRYMGILQQMFGPRDSRFVFGSIRESVFDDVPQTHFPHNFHFNGDCVVDIQISRWPWQVCSYSQGAWQVAHECVHMLDPGVQGTNVLEEGLATWFQNEPRFHDNSVRTYIMRSPTRFPAYISARRLVQHCMPHLVDAIKNIRGSGVRIRDITSDSLAHQFPDMDRNIVDQLCSRF